MTSRAAGSYARWWKQGHEQSCSYAHWLRQWLKPSVFAHFRKAAPEQKGFLLMEYVFSLAAGAVLAALVCTGLGRTAISWQRLQEQLQGLLQELPQGQRQELRLRQERLQGRRKP